MMILSINPTSAQAIEIKERIKSLSLAHQVAETNGASPSLTSGSVTYEGFADIMRYIDQLASEADQWYYCGC